MQPARVRPCRRPMNCFNPHPLRGAGATDRRRRQTRCGSRFNPHPLRGAGATTRITPNYCARNVSILTRSEERVQLFMAMLRRLKGNVSILTRSEERVQPAGQLRRALGQRVSILTRSEERVQPLYLAVAVEIGGFNPHPLRGAGATRHRRQGGRYSGVSILTRSEERVQRHGWRRIEFESMFQSSPAPRSGCNLRAAGRSCRGCRFQSSPAPRSGCNARLLVWNPIQKKFQSSPAPRSGCNRRLY